MIRRIPRKPRIQSRRHHYGRWPLTASWMHPLCSRRLWSTCHTPNYLRFRTQILLMSWRSRAFRCVVFRVCGFIWQRKLFLYLVLRSVFRHNNRVKKTTSALADIKLFPYVACTVERFRALRIIDDSGGSLIIQAILVVLNVSMKHPWSWQYQIFTYSCSYDIFVQVMLKFAGPLGINRILTYLETGEQDTAIKPWVWIIWMFIGPLAGSAISQRYMYMSVRPIDSSPSFYTHRFMHRLVISCN